MKKFNMNATMVKDALLLPVRKVVGLGLRTVEVRKYNYNK